MAEVRQKLARPTADDKSYLASFLHSTESKKHRTEIVTDKAERLAALTREPEAPPATHAVAPEWAAVQRCEAWLTAPEAECSDRSPSFDDLDALARTASDLQGRETVALASMDSFASAVVDATATRWTGQAWGAAVWDLPSAERFVASEGGPEESWPVVMPPDGPSRSAIAEVDELEVAFEVRDGNRDESEWSDPSRAAPDSRTDDLPLSE